MIERVKADRGNLYSVGASKEKIEGLERELSIKLPKSFKEFLKEFDGGEFLFGRVFCISPDGAGFMDFKLECEKFFSANPLMGLRSVIPFADDYGGNIYLFDCTRERHGEYPVVLYDHEYDQFQSLEKVADNFEAFVKSSYEDWSRNPDLSVTVYLGADADLRDWSNESLTLSEIETPEKHRLKSLNRDKYYRLEPSSPVQLATKKADTSCNAAFMSALSALVERALAESGSPVGVYFDGTGEQSTNPKFQLFMGNLRLSGKETLITSGDCLVIDTASNQATAPMEPFPNFVEYPVADAGGSSISCSFCGASQESVKKLIAGPSAYICNDCIELCNDIVSEELFESPN